MRSFLEFLRGFALSLAIASLTIYAGVCVYSLLHQKWESERFEESAAPAPNVAKPSPARPERKQPEITSGVLGRVSIPRLHIAAMVEEGDDDGTLSAAVGHIPGTALPGNAGNVGLAGHRDTFFARVKELRRGDEIDFETRSAVFKYRVEQLVVVDPKNTSVLKGSGENRLTLVTCYPFHYIGPAPKRFIVQARQMSESAKVFGDANRSLASRAQNFRPR